MDTRYSAFISYRHHPQDIAVAEKVHKWLERYPVPRALRREGKKIGKIFRDKEELPVTSNLSEDISDVLQTTDFLIVICSSHTRESEWVEREIRMFLSCHDISHVLTVLVDGQPQDIIPDILLSQKKRNPRTGEMEAQIIEPLSCDWRMPVRKARREELPRLAAALLHCSYDDLRQRQRHYRMQKIAAAATAALGIALCFLGYFLYANHRLENANREIQRNLDQAMWNQSVYLASASREELESGDRMMALLLALEALPGDDRDRPYVSEASAALQQALGVYTTQMEMTAVGTFRSDAVISGFQISEDARTLFTMDETNKLTVWDTVSLQKKAELLLTGLTDDYMQMTGDGNLLVGRYEMVCVSPEGEILWEQRDFAHRAYAIRENLVLSLHGTSGEEHLSFYRADTGKRVRADLKIEGMESPRLTQERFAGLDTVFVYSADSAISDVCFGKPDFSDGSLRMTDFSGGVWIDAATDREGNILAAFAAPQSAFYYNGSVGKVETTSPYVRTVVCMDPETLDVLWSTQITGHIFGKLGALRVIPDSDEILFVVDNVIARLDGKTGKILGQTEMPAMPLNLEVEPHEARAMLDDGRLAIYDYEKNYCDSMQMTPGGLQGGIARRYCFINRQTSQDVEAYAFASDENWMPIGESNLDYRLESLQGETYIAAGFTGKLLIIEAESRQILWEIEPEGHPLGFSRDGRELWYRSSDGKLIVFDCETGAEREIPIPNGYEMLFYNIDEMLFTDSFAVCPAWDYQEHKAYLAIWDQISKSAGMRALEIKAGEDATLHLLGASDRYALIWDNCSRNVTEVCLDNGKNRILRQNTEDIAFTAGVDETCMALQDPAGIVIRPWGSDEEILLPMDGCFGISACPWDDGFLAMGSDGNLYRYDRQGALLGQTELTLYTSFYTLVTGDSFRMSRNPVTWIPVAEDYLLVIADDAGNLIHCGQWTAENFIPHCRGYFADPDTFLTRKYHSDGTMQLGMFKRYSLAELTAMAEEILNGLEMTWEQRYGYGLITEP